MERRFCEGRLLLAEEIRRFLPVFVLLLCVGWQMFAWVNSVCVCVYVHVYQRGCVCMRWCAQIYGTTSKVKLRKIFFCSTNLNVLQKVERQESSHFFLPLSLDLSCLCLCCLSFVVACMIFRNCFPPRRRVNDRKFIVQTRCDDNGSVSGAELGSRA